MFNLFSYSLGLIMFIYMDRMSTGASVHGQHAPTTLLDAVGSATTAFCGHCPRFFLLLQHEPQNAIAAGAMTLLQRSQTLFYLLLFDSVSLPHSLDSVFPEAL